MQRRHAAVGALAVVVAVGAVLLATGGEEDEQDHPRVQPPSAMPGRPQEPPRRVVTHGASCKRFGGLTDPSIVRRAANIEAGPLTFVSLAEYARLPASDFGARQGSRYLAQKVLVVIRGGRDVTVAVPRSQRSHASLLWGATTGVTRMEERLGLREIADGNPAVRFKGCAGKFMEYVGGGFVIAGARCLPLDYWVDKEDVARRLVVSFGKRGECAQAPRGSG
jgi:hypothetical protein